MEEDPTELRRSTRLPHNRKHDCFKLSDTESVPGPPAKDDLTGRGLVSYIEGIKIIEFETMDDMEQYDTIAEKMGSVCCASFKQLHLPFRGFSEEECSSSQTHLMRFRTWSESVVFDENQNSKKIGSVCCASFDELHLPFRGFSEEECSSSKTHLMQFRDWFDVFTSDVFDENQNSKKVSTPSNKDKSKLKCLGNGITLHELPTCGPHGEESCVLCSANQKSLNLKMDGDGSLLPYITTPNAPVSYNSVVGSSMEMVDSEFETKLAEDPVLIQQGSQFSVRDPLLSHSLKTPPINLSAIPYIFKCCSASLVCTNPRACADLSTHFTLCVQLNPAQGRGLSKFAIKCLDIRQECNIVDRLSATIAASAAESSKTTIFLPLTKDLISCAFPKSNIVHYLKSLSSMEVEDGSPNQSEKLLGCSTLEKTSSSEYDVETLNTLTDSRSSLPSNNSNDSSNNEQVKRKQSGPTPGPQKKKSLVDFYPNSDGQRILERPNKNLLGQIQNAYPLDDSESTPETHSNNSLKYTAPLSLGYQEMDSELPPSNEERKSDPRKELSPSTLESGDFALSGSIVVTDSFSRQLSNQTDQINLSKSGLVSSAYIQHAAGKLNSLYGSVAKTGEDIEKDSGAFLSDILYPRIESTSSLTSFSPSADKTMQFPKKLDSSSGKVNSNIYSEMRKTVISEGLRPYTIIKDVVDLTTVENSTQLYEAGAAENRAKAKKSEGLCFSSDQIPKKVIIIGDVRPETDNQLELESAHKMLSTSKLKTLNSNNYRSFLRPVYKGSEVPIPTMHSQNVNLMSNPTVIDLTECSVYDTQNDNHSGVAKRATGNSKQIIDLTEGDEEQPSLNVEKTAISGQLNVISDKDNVFNIRSWSKLDQGYSREGVIEDYSVKPCSGFQELAVMCISLPSLGFIKVIRYQSGELMLNETYTARIYRQFNDLKALNSYLNSRFEKMAGVKDRSPLEWILATPGVIKLKKVRPINPKVWFHPNEYILAEDGSDRVCLAFPSNHIRSSCSKPLPEKGQLIPVAMCSSASLNKVKVPINSKEKSRTDNKTKTGQSWTSKLLLIKIGEAKNMPSFCNQSLPEKDPVIPVESKSNSHNTANKSFSSHDQQRTAQLVSVLLNKQDREELGLNTSWEKQASSDNPNYKNLFWPQDKPCGLSKPSVLISDQALSVNVNHTAQNKHVSSSAVQYIADPKPLPKLLSRATQSTGSVLSRSALSMTSKSSTSQNFRIVIASGDNQPTKPYARIQNTYLSKSQPAVLPNKQHSMANETSPTVRVLEIVDHKPSSSQIINTLMLNNDRTRLPIKTKPSHSSAAVKSSKGRTFVLLTNNKSNQPINQVPSTQTGSFTDQLRDNVSWK